MNYNAWGISWGQSWNGAWGESVIPQQSAASGIRRLQLYKLQEEELIKRATRDAAKEVKKAYEKTIGNSGKLVASEVSESSRQKQSKPVVPKKRKKVEKPTPIIPFRKIPTKLDPTVYDELTKLPTIAIEQYLFSIQATTTLYNFEVEKERRRKHRRKVAAFLLMAA